MPPTVGGVELRPLSPCELPRDVLGTLRPLPGLVKPSAASSTGVNARPLVWLALAQLAIGAAAIFARLALTATGPFAIGALRMSLAALPVVVIAAVRGRYRPIDAATEWRLAIAGVLLAVHYAAWFAALQHASVAVSTLLVCSSPIFIETWSVARTRTWRPLALASIALALAGVALVAGAPSRIDSPLGIGLSLCGAVAISGYMLLLKATDARYSTLAVIGRTYPIAAAFLAFAAWLAREPIPPATAGIAWSGILALAFVSQLFGNTILAASLRLLSVTFVATTILFEPVIAAVAAGFVFGERPTFATAAGALFILVALGLAIRTEPALTPAP